MTRVCMVAYTDYMTDSRVRREAEALIGRGDVVDVICLREQGTQAVPACGGVRLFQVAAKRYRGGKARTYLLSYLRFFLAASWRLTSLHLRQPYQVIQVHTLPDFMVFTAAIPRLLGAKVVLDVHDLMPELYQSRFGLPQHHWLIRLITRIECLSIGFAHGAIAVHQPHLDALVAHGNPANKFIILFNLPDPRLFPLSAGVGPKTHRGFRLIYHGTVSRRHGLHIAMAALARLKSDIDDVQLQIIGVGDEMAALKAQAEQLDLGGSLLLREGWIPMEAMLPILRECDVGLTPILDDGFTRYMLPVKLLEYMALGIPVVCSATATIQAYFDDCAVQYARPGDADDLAAKILDLYRRPEKRESLARNAQKVLREFNWQEQMQRYFALIDGLAEPNLTERNGAVEPTGRPFERARTSALRYAAEELKFIRSPGDLRILLDKVRYLAPRTMGLFGMFGGAPPSLQIEPTNLCNVRCICCPVADMSRPRGFMDMALYCKIIDDAASCGVKRIRLFLHGEPLLHPQIIAMVAYAKSRRLAVHLTTNGMLLDQARSKALLDAGVDSADHITISMLGDSPAIHERVMHRVDHERVVRNVHALLALRDLHQVNGPVIETIFYAMPENQHEQEAYLHHWRGVVDHARLGGVISQSFALYQQPGQPIPVRTRTCANIWERLTVLWNGDVALCCQDVDGKHIIGNLRAQSIREVWTCPQLLAIKKLHRQKRFADFPFCARCDM